MVEMNLIYQGEKHCELTHGPSGSKIETDAPKDNMGRGERFSPTDLLGAALSSCVVTTLAIYAEREGIKIDLTGTRATVVKEMTSTPRRVASLALEIFMPKGVPVEYRKRLEHVADACPVKRSLSAEVLTPTQFHYPD